MLISCLIIIRTLLSYQVNAHTCHTVTLTSNDISIWALPESDAIDTSNRNSFHDPDTAIIDSFTLEICEDSEGTICTTIQTSGTGLALSAPTTIWQMFGPPEQVSAQPIFQYADALLPLAATTAAFTNGRDIFDEPNTIQIENNDGKFNYEYKLDYNPLRPYQAPLSNSVSTITQSDFCAIGDIDGINANLCQKEYRSSGLYTSVSREFLRDFNEDGTQKTDELGNAVVVRSPLAVTNMCLVTHSFDLLTHGVEDGTFTSAPFGACAPIDECSDYYIVSCFGVSEDGASPSHPDDDDDGDSDSSDSGDKAHAFVSAKLDENSQWTSMDSNGGVMRDVMFSMDAKNAIRLGGVAVVLMLCVVVLCCFGKLRRKL